MVFSEHIITQCCKMNTMLLASSICRSKLILRFFMHIFYFLICNTNMLKGKKSVRIWNFSFTEIPRNNEDSFVICRTTNSHNYENAHYTSLGLYFVNISSGNLPRNEYKLYIFIRGIWEITAKMCGLHIHINRVLGSDMLYLKKNLPKNCTPINFSLY